MVVVSAVDVTVHRASGVAKFLSSKPNFYCVSGLYHVIDKKINDKLRKRRDLIQVSNGIRAKP